MTDIHGSVTSSSTGACTGAGVVAALKFDSPQGRIQGGERGGQGGDGDGDGGTTVPRTPKTPTVAGLRLSSVTADMLARTTSMRANDFIEDIDLSVSYSESSISATDPLQGEEEVEEMEREPEIHEPQEWNPRNSMQSMTSHDASLETKEGNHTYNHPSFDKSNTHSQSTSSMNHDQCMDLLDNSKLCNESNLLDDEEEDDEEDSSIDEGYSHASTVICDRKLALNAGQLIDGTLLHAVKERLSSESPTENSNSQETSQRNRSNEEMAAEEEEEEDITSFHLDVTEAYSESSGTNSTTTSRLSGQTVHSNRRIYDPVQHKNVSSPLDSDSITESDCSTRTSMTSANSISNIDPESFMAQMEQHETIHGNTSTPLNPQLHESQSHLERNKNDDEKDNNMKHHTPILDRFQVQVLNGGSECRVTPIENDVLKSAQSPILRQKSPLPAEKIEFHSPSLQEKKMDLLLPRKSNSLDRVRNRSHHKRLSEEKNSSISVDEAMSELRVTQDISDNSNWKDNTASSQKSISVRSFTGEFSASAFLPNTSLNKRGSIGSNGLHETRRNNGVRKSNRTRSSIGSPTLNRESNSNPEVEISNASTINGKIPNQSLQRKFSKSNHVDEKEYPKTPSNEDNNSFQSPKETAQKAFSRTPYAAAWIAKHMPKESDELLQILSGEKAYPDGTSHISEGKNMASDFTVEVDRHSISKSLEISPGMKSTEIIPQLQKEEYNDSPRIAKMQVEFDDVNSAIDLINKWIYDNGISGQSSLVAIKEKTAFDILAEKFNKKKCRSILMSLCHFRRLMMRLSSSSGKGKLFMIPCK